MEKGPNGVDRRTIIGGAAGVMALTAMPALAAAECDVVAKTRDGDLRGLRVGKTLRFRGIPYGDNTAGRRFQPPMPPTPWKGVRDAIDYGDRSPQMGPPYAKIYASWLNPQRESEDCLVLNVYTPALRDAEKRPVMVWLHGGGFFQGSAALRYADGSRMSQRGDVVVVTVNHRLNGYGYLYLADLLPDLADSGNAGTLDMILALKWVRDNIEEFGGDPGNVTIFGQSGGGSKVSTLMATPAAAGLFHKAIVQSSMSLKAREIPHAQENTRKVLAALGLKPEQADKLRTIEQIRFSQALETVGNGNGYLPVLDGRTIVRHPFDPDAPALSKEIPLMVGSTENEAAGLMGGYDETLFNLDWEQLPVRLKPYIYGLDPQKCVSELRRIYPQASASEIFFKAASEANFRGRAHLYAERKFAQRGAPVYKYLFAWRSPVEGGRWGATHSIDHAFVFDNVAVSQSMIGEGGQHQRMVDATSGSWIAFARTGNPGWPAFDPKRRATMVLSDDPKVIDDPYKEERLLFNGYRLL